MDDETKKLILETLGLFFSFCIIIFIIGSLIGCTSKLEAETEIGVPLGHDSKPLIAEGYRDY